jgi:hypothetical protein
MTISSQLIDGRMPGCISENQLSVSNKCVGDVALLEMGDPNHHTSVTGPHASAEADEIVSQIMYRS